MYSTVDPSDIYLVGGGPTNWIYEQRNIGTNLGVSVSLTNLLGGRWDTFTFVGNDTALSSFTSARIGAFNTWKSNTYLPSEAAKLSLITSNRTWLTQQRDSHKSNVYWWATNSALDSTLTLSNRVQSLMRLRLMEDRLQSE